MNFSPCRPLNSCRTNFYMNVLQQAFSLCHGILFHFLYGTLLCNFCRISILFLVITKLNHLYFRTIFVLSCSQNIKQWILPKEKIWCYKNKCTASLSICDKHYIIVSKAVRFLVWHTLEISQNEMKKSNLIRQHFGKGWQSINKKEGIRRMKNWVSRDVK